MQLHMKIEIIEKMKTHYHIRKKTSTQKKTSETLYRLIEYWILSNQINLLILIIQPNKE